MNEAELINIELSFSIEKCKVSLIVNNGFINSSFVSLSQMHNHPFYEIHFIMSGENYVHYPEGSIISDIGDIFIIPPRVSHSFLPKSSEAKNKRAAFWIDIDSDDTNNEDSFILNTLQKQKDIIRINDNLGCFEIAEDIQRELIDKKECFEEMLIYSFSKIMIKICRIIQKDDISNKSNMTHQSIMLLVEEYIMQNYKTNCSIDELSEHLNISRRQLTRLIGSIFSKSFRQMVLEFRMSMANWLIEYKKCSFETVAYEIGYGSVASFYHAYKKFYGVTPGFFRSQLQPIDI